METNMPDREEETGDGAREKRREMQRGGERNEGTEKETETQGDKGLLGQEITRRRVPRGQRPQPAPGQTDTQ